MADLKDVIDKLTNEGELIRDKGTHSIKSIKEIMQESQESPAERKQKLEDSRSAADKTNTLLESIASGVSVNSSGVSEAKKSGKLGGLLGGIGASLGGLGIGAGVAMGGLGALFAGGGYLLKQLAEFDGKAVVANVRELFKIAELTTGIGDAFVKGGQFFLTMTAIGVGLAVFGIGTALAAAGGALAKFTDPNWAQSIVDNVVILLSISNHMGGAGAFIGEGAAFGGAMIGIGAGLAVFGAGSALTGLAQFILKDDWAQRVVDNVVILLSISNHMGGAGAFIGEGAAFGAAMLGIGAGLAVFALGTAATGLAQFITKDDWATKVKNSVVTLLSIKDSLGSNLDLLKDSGAFVLAMTGIAAGLAVFSAGQGVTAVAKFVTEDDWAQKIKDSVTALMSIIDDKNMSQEKANTFSSVMGTIADGLVKFSGGTFVGALGSAAAGVLNFLSGTESPITEIKNLAAEADNIEKGANAIGKIADNLDKIGDLKFDGSNVNIKGFAEDLLDSVPAIEAAIMGGKIEGGFWSSDIVYKGLASADIKWSDAAKNIKTIQAALKVDPVEVVDSTGEDIAGATNSMFGTLKRSIDDLTAQIALIPVGGNTVNAPTTVRNEGDVVGGSPVVNTRYGNGNGAVGVY